MPATVPATDALFLTQDGRTDYHIELPETAPAMARHAAEELAGFLREVTGAAFPIEAAAGPAIQLNIDSESGLGPEAFTIRTAGRNLEITGGGPSGLLYGVYHFLERYAGVRWYGPDYTLTPHRPTLRLPAIDDRQAPRFTYREVFTRHADDPAYAARNRLNGRFGHRLTRAPGQWPAAFVPVRQLSIFELLPPDRYKDEHPGYYGGGQLRFANPEVRRIAVEEVKKALGSWPEEPYHLLIVHADRDSYYRGGRDGELIDRYGAPSAAYVDFVRTIAEAVADDYPHVTVLAQAYLWSRRPPEGMALPGNMGVMFSVIERDFGEPLGAPVNRAAVADLEGWGRLTDRILVWDYITNFANYLQPYPNIHTLGPDMALLGRHPSVTGVFAQGVYNTVGAGFSVLRTWVLAHLMWNPEQDAEALVADFLRGYYGAAAAPLAEYIELLHAAVRQAGGRLGDKVPPTAGYLTAELLRGADHLFEKAEQAVADDPARLRHVRVARIPVDYAILASQPAGPEWGSHDTRLARLEQYLALAGVTAYREGRGNPPEELLEVLAIERRTAERPAPCEGLPESACRIAQDTSFDLAGGASLAADPAASDGAAATMAGDSRAWGIQLPLGRLLPEDGNWQLYLEVRAESASGDAEKPALYTGVYPGEKRTVLRGDVAGDDYRIVEIPGLWQGGSDRYVWVAPPGSRSVKAIHVDRIIAVRQEAP